MHLTQYEMHKPLNQIKKLIISRYNDIRLALNISRFQHTIQIKSFLVSLKLFMT